MNKKVFELQAGSSIAAGIVGAANAVGAVRLREEWWERFIAQHKERGQVTNRDALTHFDRAKALVAKLGRRTVKRQIARVAQRERLREKRQFGNVRAVYDTAMALAKRGKPIPAKWFAGGRANRVSERPS